MAQIKEATVIVSALLLLAVTISSSAITVNAAAVITISTDRSSYLPGQTLTISGTVSPVTAGQDVAIIIYDPTGNLRAVDQVTPNPDGTYSKDVMTFAPGNPSGTWSAKVTYQAASATASFTFSVGPPPRAPTRITCGLSDSSITVGLSITVTGSINASLTAQVTIQANADGSTWINLTTVNTDSGGRFSYSWTPNAVGTYRVRASWPGNQQYSEATSDIVTLTVTKVSTTISCSVSPAEVNQGSPVTTSGSINPAAAGKNVTLTYKKPDGATSTKIVKTGSDGKFTDTYTPDTAGSWTVSASWTGDQTYRGASSSSASFTVKKSGCLVATATYGSELTPEVQFLREFRDGIVLKTFGGRNFMEVFNAWYYSFSPSVASGISGSEALRGAMRVMLYPLIGILHLSYWTFSIFNFNPEMGVVVAGTVASALIAIVYFMPLALPLSLLSKFRPSAKILRLACLVWIGSITAMALAEAASSSHLMMASSGAFILATIFLTNLATIRMITKHCTE